MTPRSLSFFICKRDDDSMYFYSLEILTVCKDVASRCLAEYVAHCNVSMLTACLSGELAFAFFRMRPKVWDWTRNLGL